MTRLREASLPAADPTPGVSVAGVDATERSRELVVAADGVADDAAIGGGCGAVIMPYGELVALGLSCG